MDDLISREQAYFTLTEYYHHKTEIQHRGLREALNSVPSVQPERKKGQWIPMFNGTFKGGAYWFECSKCGRIVPEVRNGEWDFCPKCGSYNGGE